MTTRTGFAIAALFLGLVPAAWAKDPPKSKADELLKQGQAAAATDPGKAATLYGQAVAAAHKANDLPREEAAANALEALLDAAEGDADPTPDKEKRAGRPKARAILAAVLGALDAKRHGAFVSAHAIATELLGDAVAAGDGLHVDAAAAALATYASTPKTGKAGPALASWGEGVRAARAGDAVKADAALSAALSTFVAEEWLSPATYAATELAALRVKASETGAAKALEGAAGLVQPESDKIVVQEWMRVVATRLPGAPETTLADFRRVTAPFDHAASEGTAGGAGGRGADAGENVSKLGAFLSKPSVNWPFVSATRTARGLALKGGFEKDPIGTHKLRRGQQHWEDGGLTVAIAGWAVALRTMDLVGTAGQPSERLRPSRGRAFYLLGIEEGWSVSKAGVVSVSSLGR
jgi:hypothetical protein